MMKTAVCGIAGILLAVGLSPAQAAPNIPPSELPGRERQRFLETPVDRFTDPVVKPRSVEPLWQWQCHQRSTSRYTSRRGKENRAC